MHTTPSRRRPFLWINFSDRIVETFAYGSCVLQKVKSAARPLTHRHPTTDDDGLWITIQLLSMQLHFASITCSLSSFLVYISKICVDLASSSNCSSPELARQDHGRNLAAYRRFWTCCPRESKVILSTHPSWLRLVGNIDVDRTFFLIEVYDWIAHLWFRDFLISAFDFLLAKLLRKSRRRVITKLGFAVPYTQHLSHGLMASRSNFECNPRRYRPQNWQMFLCKYYLSLVLSM